MNARFSIPSHLLCVCFAILLVTKPAVGQVSINTDNNTIEKYCHGDTEANCDIYGGLYQWGEVMNYTASSSANPSGRQGICPDGWHLPSDAEVCQLETFLDATVNCTGTSWRGTTAGGSLKETGYEHWNSPMHISGPPRRVPDPTPGTGT